MQRFSEEESVTLEQIMKNESLGDCSGQYSHSPGKSFRRVYVHPVTMCMQRWPSSVCRQVYYLGQAPQLFIEQIYIEGHCWEFGNKWEPCSITSWSLHINYFCFKILYIQRYLCSDYMTTVCHSIKLSDMTWIHKNLVLKLLDLQEKTLALHDKSWKEIILKRPSTF